VPDDPLQPYREKRDFSRTPEPEGIDGRGPSGGRSGGLGRSDGGEPLGGGGQEAAGGEAVREGAAGGEAAREGAAGEGAAGGGGTAGARAASREAANGEGAAGGAAGFRFVIQKHAARRLHYDLRLEVDGVMPSWAVPKGPSYDPKVRRLAVHVEDHPLDYRTFEGRIPGGAYGAGAVIVWDEGTYRNDSDRDGTPLTVRQAMDKGHVTVWFQGAKLRGGWHLVRTAGKASGAYGSGKDNWLLIKQADDRADPGRDVTRDEPASVVSGRNLEEVAAGAVTETAVTATAVTATAVTETDAAGPDAAGPDAAGTGAAGTGTSGPATTGTGAAGPATGTSGPATTGTGAAGPGAVRTAGPGGGEGASDGPAAFVPPMLARSATVAEVASHPGAWVLERKLDGLRCLAVRNGEGVRLWSRNRLSYTGRFPGVVAALATLPAGDFTLDGEIVVFDGDDRTSFGLLQGGDPGATAVFVAFDLLHLLGRSTTHLVTTERRSLLDKVVEAGPVLQISREIEGEPADAMAMACRSGWEGVVAKRRDAPYVGGRSSAWCKLKCTASQELVIGGWTEPQGSRAGFGALLVGVHDDTGLRYAGKVGTGFDARTLARLTRLLVERERKASPFVDPVREPRVHWAEPDLVAAVNFTEWTSGGRLRHPAFDGLRDDKPASTVRREPPAS
jgi:bifunctional non-homologous end joining protein LigD